VLGQEVREPVAGPRRERRRLPVWCEQALDVRRLRWGGHLVEYYRDQGCFGLTALTYPRVVLVVGPQITAF